MITLNWHRCEESNPLPAALETASRPTRIRLHLYIGPQSVAQRVGAPERIRTPVHRVRSAALCPLSYGSVSDVHFYITKRF
jgi:hypothetical protein